MIVMSNKNKLYKEGHIPVLRDFDSNTGKYPQRTSLNELGYSTAQLRAFRDSIMETIKYEAGLYD